MVQEVTSTQTEQLIYTVGKELVQSSEVCVQMCVQRNRKRINITLDPEVVKVVKERTNNFSRYTENALIQKLNEKCSQFNSDFGQNCSENIRGCGVVRSSLLALGASEQILDKFKDFCDIDLDLAEGTVKRHLINIEDLLEFLEVPLKEVTKDEVREYLKVKKDKDAKYTYANRIKSLRRFFRDFLEVPKLVESFQFPRIPNKNHEVPRKEDLQKHYNEIVSQKYRALFLVKATSGLRLNEIVTLKMDNIDLDKRMLVPNHDSRTKRSYVSFYNEEAQNELEKYLQKRKDGDKRVFQAKDHTVQRSFNQTSDRSGVKITPKTLRKWFTKEMQNQKVPGEYIDAFCGRLPKSVRAKHYTDYSEERLKEVYDSASIVVLE